MAKSWRMDIDLPKVTAGSRNAAADGMALALEHILGVSNSRAPHEEGTLERSGEPFLDREKLVGGISYNTPYAVRQHEDMTLRHDPGRQAKYLETAMADSKAEALDIIGAQVRRSLRG